MNAAELKSKGIKTFQTKKIDVDGVMINYAEAGCGEVLIMIHGWTNNWTGFIPIGVHLHTKYKIIIIDLPGYGDSGQLSNYDFGIQAEYLYKFIKKLDINKPILIGHSMGNYVVAKLYSNHFDIAKRIIMLAPMFRKNNKTIRLKLTELFFRAIRKSKWSTRIVKTVVNTYSYSYFTGKYFNMYKYDKSIIDTYGTEGKRRVTEKAYVDLGIEIAKTNIDDLITDNKIPIDLIFGKYDKLTNAVTAAKILSDRGKYKIEVVDNVGHILTVEKPTETAAAIEKLLN